MKTLALTIALCLVLCSCSKGGADTATEKALEMRTMFLESSNVTITSTLKADYGDKIYTFRLRYTGSADGGTIEVLSPDSLAGVKARIAQDGTSLEYDGAIIDTGTITSSGLTPIEAFPLMLSLWQNGYISACGFETYEGTDAVAADIDISDTAAHRVWIDAETLLPIHAELSENGRAVILCDFENITAE